MMDNCDREFSQKQIENFKRFINTLPEDLVNPHIWNPSEGIGLQFSWNFVSAVVAISEDKIYVEKLDNDHICDTRDEWFDYKDEDSIPDIILGFLKKHFSISEIGLENYLERKRLSIKIHTEVRKEYAHDTKNMTPIQKLGYALAKPVSRNLDYASVFKKAVNVKD